MNHNVTLGNFGENLAAEYLINNKYKIIERNHRTPYGEIDIVAAYKNIVIFVEVKTRTSDRFGTGVDAITNKKLRTMIKCAEYYIHANRIYSPVRIDVISIDLSSEQKITHIKGVI